MSRTKYNSNIKLHYSPIKYIKVLHVVVFLFVINLLLTSCAYYNYLYHAKKHFETGEKELREKPQDGKTSKPKRRSKSSSYQKAIESAGRMLEFYPDSRWEEEAILLLAKSYYRTDQFRKSISKADEMAGKYPDSEFLEEAILWKGMSLLKVAQPDSARMILGEISNKGALPKLNLIAHQALGDYYYSEERWETAKREYNYVVESEFGEEWIKGLAIMKVSDCLNRLDRKEEALELLNKVLDRRPRGNTKFEAAFQRSKVLYDMEQYQEAYEGFSKLLRNGTFESEFMRVELEVARCEIRLGDITDGKDRLEDLIEEKSKGAIAAEAQFELGMLFWSELGEISKSHEALRGVKGADRNSEYAALADSMLNQIETLSGFWQRLSFTGLQVAKIDSSITGSILIFPADTIYIDTLKAAFKSKPNKNKRKKKNYRGRDDPIQRMVDEARKAEKENELALDSAVVDTTAPLDSSQIAELFTVRKSELQQAVLDIANHYLFIDEFRDSSLYFFDIYLANDLNDEEWGKAISSISYIYFVSGDSTRQHEYDAMIIERLTEGNYVKGARRNLGLATLKAEIDTFEVYFEAAEKLWMLEDNPMAAREVYINIGELADSTSDVRARALYASAYLSRHIIGNDSIAQGYFKRVQTEFSGSDFAKSARNAINLAFVNYTGKSAKSDDNKISLRDDLNDNYRMPKDDYGEQFEDEFYDEPEKIYDAKDIDVDDFPELTTPRMMLESLQETYYPFRARSGNISGTVELEFLVDDRGGVSEIIIISEEPADYEFGEAAIEVLEQLRYRGGRYRGIPVTIRMNQRFVFDAPK